MATYTKRVLNMRQMNGAPYGDMVALTGFRLETNATGVPQGSDATTPLLIADVLRLGLLPVGTRLVDYIGVVSDAFSALSTFDLGFAYVDGVDVAAVPQSTTYFAAATSLAATALVRKTTITPPVVLPKDAWLILTNAGAAQAVVGVLDVTVIGQAVGAA